MIAKDLRMDVFKTIFQATLLVVAIYTDGSLGHGGMLEPPMRSVAWKYGFDAPVNYDWMSLYCGGLNNFTKNNGKCGLCGDSYGGPYENEKGGIYDTGIIVRHYPAGLRQIEVKVEITAHHKGSFQFKLCPNNAEELTQSCLDRYPLVIRESRQQEDPTRFYPPKDPKLNELHVLLPQGVICDRCVLQWTYTAGNNIGRAVQETFVNCADISIGGTIDKVPVTNTKPSDGAVVVIKQRPEISKIIDQASPESVNEVLAALTGITDADAGGSKGSSSKTNVTPRPRRRFRERKGPRSRSNGNRDPRMMVPSRNDFSSSSRHMPNTDTPGRRRDSPFDTPMPSTFTGNGWDWGPEDRFWGQDAFIPNPTRGPFQDEFLPFPTRRPHFSDDRMIMDLPHPTNIPPPSRVTFAHSNNGQQLNRNGNTGLNGKGSHTSLLGSVKGVATQLNKGHGAGQVGDRGAQQTSGSVPSRQFVNQMNDLRRTFPNSHDWRRGDGMLSSRHAVRHTPREDTQDFATGEIRQLVPSLPSDIGPRQDVSPRMDRRFRPDTRDFRDNWFPRWTQPRRMRQMPRRRSRLPRRIEVQTMAVAQHLLRKYPQLRGRVYLSRQGHLRNQFAHMMNKYARRRNLSRV